MWGAEICAVPSENSLRKYLVSVMTLQCEFKQYDISLVTLHALFPLLVMIQKLLQVPRVSSML